MSKNGGGFGYNNTEFRGYYEQFRKFPPLKANEELRLLHVIKGKRPPKASEMLAIDRLWDDGEEKSFDSFLDSIFGKNGRDKTKRGRKPTPDEQTTAKDTFVLHNMRLVLSRVLKYRNQNDQNIMELVSYGTDGLYRAIDLFDLSRQVRFSTYAVHWIDSFIRKGMEFVDGRKPPAMRRMIQDYKKAEKDITEETGQRPGCLEVAEKLGWGIQNLTTYHTTGISNIPVEMFDAEEEGLVPVDDALTQREMVEALRSAMPVLNAAEEDIIRRHYGWGFEEETLQSLANVFTVTKERIRQIENGGLQKLYMEVRHFRDRDN